MKISKSTKFYIASIFIGLFYIPVSWLSFELVDSGFGKKPIDSFFTLFKSVFGFLCLYLAIYFLFKIDLENKNAIKINYVKMPQFIRSVASLMLIFLSLYPFYFWFSMLIH
ncbi:hypothetical protein LEP1GSC192_1756 [Leptospira sp. B5-022]|nr:hypothetical protein LEP1GSC192_3639 [Leptospira sp. B5-022]EMK02349.1 hypothetical protein LEP1GSC192_1756 [Leptospira sp. B5-022]